MKTQTELVRDSTEIALSMNNLFLQRGDFKEHGLEIHHHFAAMETSGNKCSNKAIIKTILFSRFHLRRMLIIYAL